MTQRENRKKPDLTFTRFTSEQLDEMAEIADQDIVSADDKWREHSRGKIKDLLKAEAE